MIKKCLLTTLLFLSLSAGSVFAKVADNLNFNGYIADEANVLKEQAEENINLTLDDLSKKTGNEIALVLLPSLEGQKIEDVSSYIYNTYKIGNDNKKNGVVLLIGMSEQQLNVYLGEYYKDRILADEVRDLVQQTFVPYFEKDDYENGVMQGTYVIADRVAKLEKKRIKHYGISNEGFNKGWLWLILPLFGILLGGIWFLANNKSGK